jgi:hypothetical protein
MTSLGWGVRWLLPGILIFLVACGSDPPPQTSPSPFGTGTDNNCSRTSVGYNPLSEPGPSNYQGQPGGLYPGGSNVRPAGHEADGLAIAQGIGPLGPNGNSNPNGRYALVSIGFSNATQEFFEFKQLGDSDAQKDPRLAIVDGAQSGQASAQWADPSCQCWMVLGQRLNAENVSPNQVAIVWMKLALSNPTTGWPEAAQTTRSNGATVVQMLKQRFPNLALLYLSSRIYGGYATGRLNPEPYAYESGLSVRWLLEDQLGGSSALNYSAQRGAVNAPWLSWGPYLWADGTRPRSDGLSWSCSDMESDGVHPGPLGERKVANMLLVFFRSDSTAREWYLANP